MISMNFHVFHEASGRVSLLKAQKISQPRALLAKIAITFVAAQRTGTNSINRMTSDASDDPMHLFFSHEQDVDEFVPARWAATKVIAILANNARG